MDLLVVVPHFDDAVLSLGTHLNIWARRYSVHVATCCGLGGLAATQFDRASGFTNGIEAIITRRDENEHALNSLGIESTSSGPFCDAQYDQPSEPSEVVAWLRGLISMFDPLALVSLLGLHHPDHKLLAHAVSCCDSAVYDQFVAEDLPYRVSWPHEVAPALARANATYMASEVSASMAKEDALRLYPSQLWSLPPHQTLCPERLWRVA